MESVLADSAPSRVSVSDMGLFRAKNWETLDHVDDRKIAQIAGATARSKTFSSATVSIFKLAFGTGDTDEAIQSRPDWQHMPAAWRRGYMNARQRFWNNPPNATRRSRYVEDRYKLVKAIADSGCRIMSGSYSPEWLHVY